MEIAKNHSLCAPTPPSGLCLECECERLTEELRREKLKVEAMRPVVEAAQNHSCQVAPWFRLQRCNICIALDAYEKEISENKVETRIEALIASVRIDVKAEIKEWRAQVAESEPNLEGPMPDENWVMSQRVRLEDHLRVTVDLTKRNIAKRIRES